MVANIQIIRKIALTANLVLSQQPLRVALKRLSIPSSLLSLIPDSPDGMYFSNMLKSLKVQAKTEATRYYQEHTVPCKIFSEMKYSASKDLNSKVY